MICEAAFRAIQEKIRAIRVIRGVRAERLTAGRPEPCPVFRKSLESSHDERTEDSSSFRICRARFPSRGANEQGATARSAGVAGDRHGPGQPRRPAGSFGNPTTWWLVTASSATSRRLNRQTRSGGGIRVVCTELIYRSYHNRGNIRFTLTKRLGRYTLSGDDIVAHVLDASGPSIGPPPTWTLVALILKRRDALAHASRAARIAPLLRRIRRGWRPTRRIVQAGAVGTITAEISSAAQVPGAGGNDR